MAKVSKNEIMLLIVMIVGIALYLAYYFVKIPLDEEYAMAEANVRTVEAELLDVQSRIATKEGLETTYDKHVVTLSDVQTVIREYMHDEDFDDRMVTLMEENEVATRNVAITNEAGGLVASTIEGLTYKSYGITVFGTEENIYSFIDSIYAQTDMALISINIGRNHGIADEDMADMGVEVEMQCAMNIVVCMTAEE